MLTQYMFAFVFPDTGLPSAAYVDINVPDGIDPLEYANEAWTKHKLEKPRLQQVPYELVGVYIRSADGLYIQVHAQASP